MIRIYLVTGLVLHKAVWEVMKRRVKGPAAVPAAPGARLLSALKIVILAAIAAQTLLPDFLPISSRPDALRVAGVILYTAGLAIAVSARIQLGRNWSDIEKSFVADTHLLVAHGLYRLVRHPIYAGDVLLVAGLELALNSWAVLVVVPLMFYVRMQAVTEENKLLTSLPGYDRYYRETPRFVPLPGLPGKHPAA